MSDTDPIARRLRRAVERQNEDRAKKAGLPADFASVHPEKPAP